MSDMTLADALEKVQEWIGELVEVLDPSVTIQRAPEPIVEVANRGRRGTGRLSDWWTS